MKNDHHPSCVVKPLCDLLAAGELRNEGRKYGVLGCFLVLQASGSSAWFWLLLGAVRPAGSLAHWGGWRATNPCDSCLGLKKQPAWLLLILFTCTTLPCAGANVFNMWAQVAEGGRGEQHSFYQMLPAPPSPPCASGQHIEQSASSRACFAAPRLSGTIHLKD